MTVDIGNTRTKFTLFHNDTQVHTDSFSTTDQWNLDVLKNLPSVDAIAVSSVVPSKNLFWEELARHLKKPIFFLSAQTISSITFDIETPQNMGADRIAGLVGASTLYTKDNIVVVDMGTATTLNLLTNDKIHPGGAILAGVQTSIESLTKATALLPEIDLTPTPLKIGKNTQEQLQLHRTFYLYGLKELIETLAHQAFGRNSSYKIIGTGGYAHLFEDDHLFDHIHPDLKFIGIRQSFLMYGDGQAPLQTGML